MVKASLNKRLRRLPNLGQIGGGGFCVLFFGNHFTLIFKLLY